MGLESFSGIWSLNSSNPTASDDINQGDDHIRGIKASIRQTFPNVSATVGVTASELNHLSGVASNIQNSMDTISSSLQDEISRTDILSSSLNTALSTIADHSSNLATISTSLQAVISNVDTISTSLQQVISDAAVAYGGFYLNAPAIQSASTSMSALTLWDAPMPSSNVTLTTAAGSITIVTAGTYYVSANFSFTGVASTEYSLQIFKTDNETPVKLKRAFGSTVTIGAASMSGIVSANATDVFKVRLEADSADVAFEMVDGSFNVVRISS